MIKLCRHTMTVERHRVPNQERIGGASMAGKAVCKIPECGNPSFGKEMCRLHFQRWKRTGQTEVRQAAQGAPLRFLKAALETEVSECIFWPYAKHRKGFGLIMYQGKTRVAARVVCEMLHGPPASASLQAAHGCGNGHLACVNPYHLRWATKLENAADQLLHGTRPRGEQLKNCVLSEQDVLAIKEQLKTETIKAIAARYGVSFSTVQCIKSGRNWGWLTSAQQPSEPPQSSRSCG